MRLARCSLLTALALCISMQLGCYFSAGGTTFHQQAGPSGTGFITATNINGRWDIDGPPPQVGDVIERSVYRYFVKSRSFCLFSSEQDSRLGAPYSYGRYKITAIREVKAEKRQEAIVHYYQVSVDPA